MSFTQKVDIDKKPLIEQIKETEEKLAALRKELEQPEGRWKAAEDENYFYVTAAGEILSATSGNDTYDNRRYEFATMFKTKESADAYRMRLKAAADKWKPEMHQIYFYFDLDDGDTVDVCWYADNVDISRYWIGNVHKTREEAQEWGDKYSKYFF
jgi:hypothetical protein